MVATSSSGNTRPLPERNMANVTLDGPSLDRRVPIIVYVDASVLGGTASYGVAMAEGLIRRGYRVTAVCNDTATVAPMRSALERAGADVHSIAEDDPSIFGRIRRVRRVASIVRRHRGCSLVLLLGYFSAGDPVLLAGVLGGAGSIIRADLQPPMPPVAWWRRGALMRLKDRLVHRIIVGSLENRQTFVRETGRRSRQIAIIHTGIDLPKYVPGQGRVLMRASFGYSPVTLVVGMIARLSEERKGAAYFVEMAAQVARIFPESAFLIIGDGSLRSQLERQATALGVSERMRFEGWRSDFIEALATMDVFVMPSLVEGGPMVVLEAMAMGLPVVATRVGMVPEVIEDGRTGFVVEPADAAALVDSVRRLLGDEQLRSRIGNQAREKANHAFSLDVMVGKYLNVFAEARSRRPRRWRKNIRRVLGISYGGQAAL